MLRETAYAKINLALHVRARRADGYHAIETLFAFAADGDELTLGGGGGVSLEVKGPFAAALGGDASGNLVLQAARAFLDRFGSAGGARFALDKRLPVAAGIGGGSADAAAALRLLARRDVVAPGDPALLAIAAALGADVPACLASLPVCGAGRGDALFPIDGAMLAGLPLLLVNPREPLSTAAVFHAWDGRDRGPLGRGDPLSIAAAGRNDMEEPAIRIVTVIEDVLASLRRTGASLVRMSGSGATCFGLFPDLATRDAAAAAVAAEHPRWWRMATRLR